MPPAYLPIKCNPRSEPEFLHARACVKVGWPLRIEGPVPKLDKNLELKTIVSSMGRRKSRGKSVNDR
jgi:hypothetical protein